MVACYSTSYHVKGMMMALLDVHERHPSLERLAAEVLYSILALLGVLSWNGTWERRRFAVKTERRTFWKHAPVEHVVRMTIKARCSN